MYGSERCRVLALSIIPPTRPFLFLRRDSLHSSLEYPLCIRRYVSVLDYYFRHGWETFGSA